MPAPRQQSDEVYSTTFAPPPIDERRLASHAGVAMGVVNRVDVIGYAPRRRSRAESHANLGIDVSSLIPIRRSSKSDVSTKFVRRRRTTPAAYPVSAAACRTRASCSLHG